MDVDGERLVLKDFDGCDRWFALILGRFFCAREARALAELNDVVGVPRLVARVGARALTMEFADGQPVKSAQQSADWPAYFQDLERVIGSMHACDVAHCDLRSPGNALIDAENRAWLVDFTGSFRSRMLLGWVFEQLAWVDRSAIIKIKRRVAPECISKSEHDAAERGHVLERPARIIGQGVRTITRRLLTRN